MLCRKVLNNKSKIKGKQFIEIGEEGIERGHKMCNTYLVLVTFYAFSSLIV